jgi:CheY-like chemotaxis protein
MDILPSISPRSPRGKSNTTSPRTPPLPSDGTAASGLTSLISVMSLEATANSANSGSNKVLLQVSRDNSKGSLSLPLISPATATPGSRRSSHGGLEVFTSLPYEGRPGSFRQTPLDGQSGQQLFKEYPEDEGINNTSSNSITNLLSPQERGGSFSFPPQPAEPVVHHGSSNQMSATMTEPAVGIAATGTATTPTQPSQGPPASSVYTHSQVHRSSRIESTDNMDFSYMTSTAIQYAAASASRDGTLLTVDEKFAELCDSAAVDLIGKNVIDLAVFESPDEMMLASCTISALGKDDTWVWPLNGNPMYGLSVTVHPNPLVTPPAARSGGANRGRRARDILRIVITPNVTYTFPRRENNLSTVSGGVYSSRLPSELTSAEQLQILVVDDSTTVTSLITHQLKHEGYRVCVENSGHSALERLKHASSTQFCAVLVDVNMPGMGGLQVCHEFRAMEEQKAAESGSFLHQVLIGMTCDFSATIVHEVMAAGFDGFLPKPFSVRKFREVINGLTVD